MGALRSCGWPALVTLCTLSFVGCADPLRPSGPPAGSGDSRPYYPLAVGNRWVYARRYCVTVDSLGLRSSRVYPQVLEVQIQSDGAFSRGQTYAAEGSRVGDAGFMPRTWHVNLLRQDSKGLYQMVPTVYLGEADRQPAGPTDGPGIDATRLVFPLRVGAEWVNQNGLHARVEGMTPVSVPAGYFTTWRVALELSSPSGKTFGHEWYGDVGVVKSESHWEYQDALRDSAGAQVGMKTVSIADAYALQSIELVGPPGRLLPVVMAWR